MTLPIPLAVVLLLASFVTANAQSRTPWVEPPLGPISPVGTVIETESYRCTVTSARAISCMNIGRVCAQFRADEDALIAKMFGCAIEGSPNYPCEPWEKTTKHIEKNSRLLSACTTMIFGAF